MIGGVALVVISGVSASGKSTVARLLAERFDRGVCVPGDTIRAMIVSGQADMRPDSGEEALRQLALRYAGALSVAHVFLNGGFDVVVEDVIVGPILRKFLSIVPVPEFHLVFLDPDAAAIEQRERDAGASRTAPAGGRPARCRPCYGRRPTGSACGSTRQGRARSRLSSSSSPTWTPAASACPCPADQSRGEQGEEAAVRQRMQSLGTRRQVTVH